MRYEFHPKALEEYHEAGRYYANQQSGLDLRFILRDKGKAVVRIFLLYRLFLVRRETAF